MHKTRISTQAAPAPSYAFSQGVRKGGFVVVSGQGPVDPVTNDLVDLGDVRGQTRRTLENVRAIVEAADASFDDVVSLRVFLTDQANFAAMNETYAEFVSEHSPSGVFPVRTTVFTGLPRDGMLVEIDAIAVTD